MGPGLTAEPANVLTNLAFLAAAWASWRLAHRSGPVSPGMAALIGLMAAIGVGSAIFHTLATTWAGVLDLAPILAFQIYYLWLYCRRVVLLGSSWSTLAVTSLLIAVLVGRALPHGNEWSLTHLPALIPLLGLGIYHYYTRKRDPLTLIAAAGVFALALAFRTLDGVLCPLFPFGTHFLWHLLDAVALYLLFQVLVANWRSRPPKSGPAPSWEVVQG